MGSKILEVEIPHEEYKKMKIANGNPELGGAKTYDEFLKNQYDGVDNKYNRSLWKDLGGDKNSNTRMIEGDIDSKFIKGGRGYKKLSVKELANYIKNNPKKFLRGSGKLIIGTGGVVLGGKLIKDNAKNSNSKSKDIAEKSIVTAGALGLGAKVGRDSFINALQKDAVDKARLENFGYGSNKKYMKIINDLVEKEGISNYEDIEKRAAEAIKRDSGIENKAQKRGLSIVKKVGKINKAKAIGKGALATLATLASYAGYRKYRDKNSKKDDNKKK